MNNAPWWVLPGLALVAMLIFAGTIAAAYLAGEKQLAANLSMGALAAATMAFGYFFQSSAGSQKKDDTIAAAAVLAAATQSAPVNPPSTH